MLTDRQKEVLEFIAGYIRRAGYPPSFRDIGDEFRIKSPNGVLCHLQALKKKGYLDWKERGHRTIRVLKET